MSFIEQIENRRIKTLAQDLTEDVSSTGQLWDTYHEELETILADDYWDASIRPLKTNDEIMVRYHDPVSDGIAGEFKLLTGYAKIVPGYEYKSKLIRVDKGYCTLDVSEVSKLTEETEYVMSVTPAGKLAELYVFVDGQKTAAGATIKLMNSTGERAQVTLTVPANASYGAYQFVNNGFETTAANAFKLNIQAANGETAKFKLHIVGVLG